MRGVRGGRLEIKFKSNSCVKLHGLKKKRFKREFLENLIENLDEGKFQRFWFWWSNILISIEVEFTDVASTELEYQCLYF